MNLPASFTRQLEEILGTEESGRLQASLLGESPVSFRFNYDKLLNNLLIPDSAYSLRKVPWTESGYYLEDRLNFTFDPHFHSGCYYVQEASSMFLEQVLRQYVTAPSVVLDLCAAPGGKSTHALSVLPAGSLLIANEVIRSRSMILAENLMKWGNSNCIVTNNDPSAFTGMTSLFDVVMADVPCSGEGMFRKDPGAITEWSPENVQICQSRQKRIIADVWPSLKPGGILIYSTCTYNLEENEKNIQWIADELGAEVLPLALPDEWGVSGNLSGKDFPVYRFFPHKVTGEGFFLAVLRKDAENGLTSIRENKRIKKNKPKQKQPVVPEEVRSWLRNPDQYVFEVVDSLVRAIPREHIELYQLLLSLTIVHAGIILAEVKGKGLIPQHSLAMSKALDREAFYSLEISYEQAIAYLRKEAIVLSPEVPKDFIMLSYKNTPLGFVKNIGNRANNLYPGEWRIRSGYLPEQVKLLFE